MLLWPWLPCDHIQWNYMVYTGGSRGVQGVRSNPPLCDRTPALGGRTPLFDLVIEPPYWNCPLVEAWFGYSTWRLWCFVFGKMKGKKRSQNTLLSFRITKRARSLVIDSNTYRQSQAQRPLYVRFLPSEQKSQQCITNGRWNITFNHFQ